MSRSGRIDALEWLLPGFRSERVIATAAPARLVLLPGHGTTAADLSLDFMGETCLRTNLVTKRALQAAKAGLVIEIVSDNLSAVETIPFMLPGHNCVHLGTLHLDGSWKVYARKCGD
mgnify:CR=1 FL=1